MTVLPGVLSIWLFSNLASLSYAGTLILLSGMTIGFWMRFGRWPRLNRGYKRVQRLLVEKNWTEALAVAQKLETLGYLSPVWQGRARRVQGECHHLAGEALLKEKRYEEGLEHLLTASRLLDLDGTVCRSRVVEEMLAELRRIFADNPGTVPQLVARISAIESRSPEALFWEAMFHVRESRLDKALTRLHEAREDEIILDPPLYLGALLLQQGRAQESLRFLADANRLAPDCPLVAWQLGVAMVAAGGADNLALRPLQKALGARGLPTWAKAPQQMWREAMPGAEKSYVARLAAKFPYVCPVFGNDVAAMVRQAQTALAQAHYRLGHFQEAADVFTSVLQEGPPTLPVLRGLGLALAKLERYDEAFKPLRAAHEWQFSREPKASGGNGDHLLAGYLALCGAKGNPSRPEDKPNNVLWAIRLLSKFDRKGDAEWAYLHSAVFAEARRLGLPLPTQDQVRWCDVLASVESTDLTAASAYYELARLSPQAIIAEHAWLYCRAAEQHGIQNEGDLILFRRAISEEISARAFYEKRGWDFDNVQYLYLTRLSSQSAEPEDLPAGLKQKLEPFLLERSKRKEQAGLESEALASMEVLINLSPGRTAGHDRLSFLHYKRGELAQAAKVLSAWHAHSPQDHWPLVRLAIVKQKLGNSEASLEAIRRAMSLTKGQTLAALGFLGGRLAAASGQLDQALQLFNQCLHDEPNHSTALWCLAATRYLLGDRAGLIGMAERMDRPGISDPRFHYLAAVTHLSGADYSRAIEASQRAIDVIGEGGNGAKEMAAECLYAKGLAHWHQQDMPAASVELQKAVSQSPTAPSADQARALLGKIRFSRQAYEEAVSCWKAIGDEKRKEWKLDESLRSAVFLAGLTALEKGEHENAFGFFREGQVRGFSEPRLPALLTAALVRASRKLLSAPTANEPDGGAPSVNGSWSNLETAASYLEEALGAGCQDSAVSYLLGLAYKRLGNTRAARQALQRITSADPDASFQMGMLSLSENKLSQADQEFDRAWQLKPDFFEAGHNLLLTRLSRGQIESALTILPRIIELARDPEEKRRLVQLEIILRACRPGNGDLRFDLALADLTPEDEEWFVRLARSLGHLDTARALLTALSACRPKSAVLRDAVLETVLIQGKRLLDRCDWAAAEKLLAPWLRERETTSAATQIGLLNLLGCCASLGQEFETARHFFSAAISLADADARLYQNLALAFEWQGQFAQVEAPWNRYLELLDLRVPTPPNSFDYAGSLAFECLSRLASRCSEKEQWPKALAYLERAHDLRPGDPETLEKLFHLLNQLKRPDEARKTLQRLQALRPNEPQLEMLALELIEVNSLENANQVISGIEQIVERQAEDDWVKNRTSVLLATVIMCLERINRQVSAQKAKARSRLRRLPKYKSDWPEMADYLRGLNTRSQKIKKLAGRCQSLAPLEYQRQTLNSLIRQIDRELEQNRALV